MVAIGGAGRGTTRSADVWSLASAAAGHQIVGGTCITPAH